MFLSESYRGQHLFADDVLKGRPVQVLIDLSGVSPGVGCSMGDTSPTRVSMETQLLPLCHREWKELLPQRSTHMQPTGPGFRSVYTRLGSAAAFLLAWLITCCLSKDPADWRVCGADARGYTGTQHSWWGTCSLICTCVVVLFIASMFYLFTLFLFFFFTDKVTKGVQLAREEAEDFCTTRLCFW